MRAFKIALSALMGLAVLGCTGTTESVKKADAPTVRIGVYDSRAIAVAAVGSEYYTHHIKPLEDAFSKAKAEGNEELIKELVVWPSQYEG